ncbi:hypothetical protein [Phenylobacterium sp.]|uniref:hypothetical protein n=1 Tax=Phenylobacterium sp. TaxID=1871053 RepID=UPI002737D31C|nr:hypothetical protein [Phenylobacterium sp.]MDP3866718.1 hypothetical protein [Phenylobacterium sp.]
MKPDTMLDVGGLTLEEELAYVRLCGARGPERRQRRNWALTLLMITGALLCCFAAVGAVRDASGLSAGAAVLAGLATVIFNRGIRPNAARPLEIADLDMAGQLDAALTDFLDGARVGASQITALRQGGTLLAAALGTLVFDVLR